MNFIAKNIELVRKQVRLSKNDFAFNLGISIQNYTHLINKSKKIPHNILFKLKTIYNVDMNKLFNDNSNIDDLIIKDFNYNDLNSKNLTIKLTINSNDKAFVSKELVL